MPTVIEVTNASELKEEIRRILTDFYRHTGMKVTQINTTSQCHMHRGIEDSFVIKEVDLKAV